MSPVGLRWPFGATLVFLHTLAVTWTGSVQLSPRLDLLHLAAVTLQENQTYWFRCQADGPDGSGPLLLTWYLDGEQQRAPWRPAEKGQPGSRQEGQMVTGPGTRFDSTFSLQATRGHHQLSCVASNPRTGENYNATVVLNVQVHPPHPEASQPDLLLLLLALVGSDSPAADPHGHLLGFFTSLGGSHGWTNHTLRILLSGMSGTAPPSGSSSSSGSEGASQSRLSLAAEWLQSRVDVPLLGVLTGGLMAFMALLILSLILLCLLHRNSSSKTFEEPVEILVTKKSDSANQEAEKRARNNMTRENMSLPANMQLHDLNTLRKAQEAAQKTGEQRTRGEHEEQEEEEDLTMAYAARGFCRYPMVGYIYRVNSTSSEEIWL